MGIVKVELSLEEMIERALEGRKQNYIVDRMNDLLGEEESINEVKFSRKKKGFDTFSKNELSALNKVLGTSFTLPKE